MPFFVDYEFIIGDLCKLCLITVIVMIFVLWLKFMFFSHDAPKNNYQNDAYGAVTVDEIVYYHIAASGWFQPVAGL